ncbi:response regulator transcription factor [Streptomyces carpaticus]|uniref:Response regulator transcription factor n=1 Tax=Streptomyces carpaticus TaxID=285558 RepID=A0ABV4ZJA1_9ACTN
MYATLAAATLAPTTRRCFVVSPCVETEVNSTHWGGTMQGSRSGANVPTALRNLTGREREVLLLMTEGWSNRIMAKKLGISERTVRAHLTSITQKLGGCSRVQAAVFTERYREHLLPHEA